MSFHYEPRVGPSTDLATFLGSPFDYNQKSVRQDLSPLSKVRREITNLRDLTRNILLPSVEVPF